MTDPSLIIYKSPFLPLNERHWFFQSMNAVIQSEQTTPLILVGTPHQKTTLLELCYKTADTQCVLPDIFTLDEWLLNLVPFEINFSSAMSRLLIYKTLKLPTLESYWFSSIRSTAGFYNHFIQFYRLYREHQATPTHHPFFNSKRKQKEVNHEYVQK